MTSPGGTVRKMRLGVLDVGSNTVHLLVVDAHRGGQPSPAASVKVPLRLVEFLDAGGRLSAEGEQALLATVRQARQEADDLAVDDLVAFATSALREAGNGAEVIAGIRGATGVDLQVLPGDDEARLTFLAVRRWFGWSAGRLLALDIGGGSLEVACGSGEEPEVAASTPLGASRLTREWLTNDPPKRSELTALRRYVRAQLAPLLPQLYAVGEPTRVVACSKTFRSVARIAGVASYSRGPFVRRVVDADQLRGVLDKVSKLTAEERAALPGVSPGRAQQLVAGALVASEVVDLLGVEEVEICPWALREGVILRRLDLLTGG